MPFELRSCGNLMTVTRQEVLYLAATLVRYSLMQVRCIAGTSPFSQYACCAFHAKAPAFPLTKQHCFNHSTCAGSAHRGQPLHLAAKCMHTKIGAVATVAVALRHCPLAAQEPMHGIYMKHFDTPKLLNVKCLVTLSLCCK